MELNFKVISLIIAVILLIVFLVLTYNSLNTTIDDKKWPPNVYNCPDYWTQDLTQDDIVCNNDKNLGLDTCPTNVNMDTYIYNSEILAKSDCAKAQWARSCNLTWDGITNKDDICN